MIIDVFGEWAEHNEIIIDNNIKVEKLGLNKFLKKEKLMDMF